MPLSTNVMLSSTDVLLHQVDDDDTGYFLLTPPSSFSKKESLWLPVAKLKKRFLYFLPETKFDNAINFQVAYFTLKLFKPYIFIILQFVRQRS